MADIKTQQELLEEFFEEVEDRRDDMTDTIEGSNLDLIGGVTSLGVQESLTNSVNQFAKTFIDTAHGPEVTGGPDDLQRLFVDHFGEQFSRPGPSKAVGTVLFERPTADAGDVTILAGTVVKTELNGAGEAQRFATLSTVVMTGTEIEASVEAIVAGPDGNVDTEEVSIIETALTDPTVTVTNEEEFAGGNDTLNDAQYRTYGRNLLKTLGGGKLDAIVAAALTVPGVVFASGFEFIKTVREYNPATGVSSGAHFKISYPVLYIGDINNNASSVLIQNVIDKINGVRAGGVDVRVIGYTAVPVNWQMEITLNPSGPNYDSALNLSEDPQPIVDSMIQYLQDLDVDEDFDISDAEDYIMGLWGPTGSDDITAVNTTSPVGDVAINSTQKAVPGTVGVV